MIELTLSAIALVILVFAWLSLGILRAVQKTLAERAALWLLPPSQPVTFRIAQFIALLCGILAPRSLPHFSVGNVSLHRRWYYLFPAEWKGLDWPDPEAALGELEADLRAERRVLDPLRLTLPLLPTALRLRLRFLWKVGVCVLWMPVGLLLYLLVPLAIQQELTIGRLRRGRQAQGQVVRRKKS